MGESQRTNKKQFADKIPVGSCVHAVLRHAGKSQFPRQTNAIDGKRSSGQSARSHGEFVSALAAIFQAIPIAQKHFEIGEQIMGEQNRLGGLKVSVTGHYYAAVFPS